MTTAYTKTHIGNGRFVVQWEFPADPMAEVEGDVFDTEGAEIISVFGITPDGLARIMLSNDSNPSGYRTSYTVPDIFLSPPVNTGNPELPPSTRFIYPHLDPGSGNLRVSILFAA